MSAGYCQIIPESALLHDLAEQHTNNYQSTNITCNLSVFILALVWFLKLNMS